MTSFPRLGLAAALLCLAGCAAPEAAHERPIALSWSLPEKRVVLIQSPTGGAAIGVLSDAFGRAGLSLVVADAGDEVESIYGGCIGVGTIAYAWESHECAEPVKRRYRADYALFLSAETTGAGGSTIAVVDLGTGVTVWTAATASADWNDASSAARTLARLLARGPF